MKDTSGLLVSIIVPIYNVETLLCRCVDSLLNQTYRNIQVILVNDGSKDNCPSICDDYQKKDYRVVVIHKENGGLSDARNAGLIRSEGDYILFVDSDDYLELDSCEKFISRLCNKNIDIVVGEAKKITKEEITFIKRTNLSEEKIYTGKEYLIYAINGFEWYAPVCFNMYRKSFLIQNSLYFKKGILHEDMQILPHLFLKAHKIAYMSYCFYNYDIREDSITQRKDKSRNRHSIIEILEEWKYIFDNVKDKDLQVKLYGILSKQCLYCCREFEIYKIKEIKNINTFFLIRYGLNYKEKFKTIIYTMFPKFYINFRK